MLLLAGATGSYGEWLEVIGESGRAGSSTPGLGCQEALCGWQADPALTDLLRHSPPADRVLSCWRCQGVWGSPAAGQGLLSIWEWQGLAPSFPGLKGSMLRLFWD